MRVRVSKKKLEEVKADLIKIAHAHAAKVKVRNLPASSKAKLNGVSFDISGYYNPGKIKVFRKAKTSNWLFLFVLAHEVRHSIHAYKGLYADYYKLDNYQLPKKIRENDYEWISHFKIPCLRTAYLAEQDCNRWAYKYLESKGIVIPHQGPYPAHGTGARVLKGMIESYEEELFFDFFTDLS